jgi:hypothetical protein
LENLPQLKEKLSNIIDRSMTAPTVFRTPHPKASYLVTGLATSGTVEPR